MFSVICVDTDIVRFFAFNLHSTVWIGDEFISVINVFHSLIDLQYDFLATYGSGSPILAVCRYLKRALVGEVAVPSSAAPWRPTPEVFQF